MISAGGGWWGVAVSHSPRCSGAHAKSRAPADDDRDRSIFSRYRVADAEATRDPRARHHDLPLGSETRGRAQACRGVSSQCGYNTALDLLDSRVPALVVPFGDVGEDEQTKRARRLEALGLLRVVAASDLTPSRLAAEMTALPAFTPSAVCMDLGGAERTTEIIAAAVGGREVRSSSSCGQQLERGL